MNEIQTHRFDAHTVRVAGSPDHPLFCATDVCRALGIVNTSQAVADLPDDEKDDISSTDAVGRQQRMLAVTEAGLYRLIFRSRKAEAEAFKTWVVRDVLPAIRKTGSYTVPSKGGSLVQQAEYLLEQARAVEAMRVEQELQRQRLDVLVSKVSEYDGETGYRTVTAYLRHRGTSAPLKVANHFGRQCADECRKRRLPIGRVPDERWDHVNSYPIRVLDDVYDGWFGNEVDRQLAA